MKVTEKVKPILVVEDEDTMGTSLRDWLIDDGFQVETIDEREKALEAELNSWDEEGKVIAKQVITRFPHLFPWFSKS